MMAEQHEPSLIDTPGFRRAPGLPAGDPRRSQAGIAIALAALAWLPTLVLSFIEGRAISNVGVSFLEDFGFAIRSLVVVPLLVLAPSMARRAISSVVEHLETSGIVPSTERARYDRARKEAVASRDSRLGEWVVMALAIGIMFVNLLSPQIGHDAWQRDPGGVAFGRSLAGLWSAVVGGTIYTYLVFGWWRRIWIWGRFLFRVSRLDLGVVGSHPDRVGGLGFLSFGQTGFGLVLFAFSLGQAARIGVTLVFEKPPIETLIPAAAALVVVEVAALLIPLAFFAAVIRRARRRAWFDYAALAGRQSRAFRDHWIGASSPPDDELRASPDVSTTADMAGVFGVVSEMSPSVLMRRAALGLAVPAVVPFLPLALTQMPLKDLLRGIASLVL